MDSFARLTFEDQTSASNQKPNIAGLSEAANTSKGAKSFAEWDIYNKTGIEIDLQLKASMMKQAAKLEPEIQNYTYTLIKRKQGITNEKPGTYQE